ncbi:MAG: glycosyltransferase family 2 protein [Alphaproteobacteria bacterium]|nr:glycosyltransferase family 2 protein [Alphaproteobacteria bacterium]
MTEKIAYVVPTMDRPDDLRCLFKSITNQTVQPDQIIIVDGSNPPIKTVCDEFKNLDITYVREYPPSLAKQRNAGMAALHPNITIAGYLDDDLELDPLATEEMHKFWSAADKNVGGASMSIIGQKEPYRQGLLRFFMMHGDPPGQILKSGFPCYIPFVDKNIETKWLYGGATLWRREVINQFAYDEWYAGHGFGEDYDYSYRVSKKYRLFVVGTSQTWHHEHPMSESKMYVLGRQQIYNRLYFIRKVGDFSRIYVSWALFGQFMINFMALLRRPKKATWDRLRGNFRGLFEASFGKQDSFFGYWKDE